MASVEKLDCVNRPAQSACNEDSVLHIGTFFKSKANDGLYTAMINHLAKIREHRFKSHVRIKQSANVWADANLLPPRRD